MWVSQLTDEALSGGRGQVGRGEWKSMWRSPGVTSIPAATATLFMSPPGGDKGAGEEAAWQPQSGSS